MSSLVELRSKLAQAPTRLLLGISIMLTSGFIANNLIQINDSTAVPVLVASSNLAAGQSLTLDDVSVGSVSKSVNPSQWLTLKDLAPGVFLKSSLKAGDVLKKSDIDTLAEDLSSLSLLIQKGRMPLSVQIGDAIDIWGISSTPMPLAQGVSITGLDTSGSEIIITVLVPKQRVGTLLENQELAITAPV